MHPVKVIKATEYNPDRIADLLGKPSLPVEHVEAPSIMVGGRYHVAGCRWLRRKHLLRPVDATSLAHARRLSGWIDYLLNERGLHHPDQYSADVFVADSDDMATFYRARQFKADTRVSSATWKAQLSTLKQFHEFLRDTYGIPLPFKLSTFRTPIGTSATTASELRPRTRTGSRGTPITPGYCELLLQGAMRIDADGHQHDARTVDRDTGFISLGLASGMRLSTLAHITTYEIPAVPAQPFTTIRVPDFITKGDAGGDALVFGHRLTAVHNYIDGDRADRVDDGRTYTPERPIHLTEADGDRWSGEGPNGPMSRTWAETDAALRLRMVNPDGTTPIVWVNPYTGAPTSYDQAGSITTDARNWTREHVSGDFPARFRTHDLRHTYATHLTVCIFKQAVAPHIHPDMIDAYTPVRVADAVEIAKLSLGHASDASTRLYIQQSPKFLHIDIDEFLGAA